MNLWLRSTEQRNIITANVRQRNTPREKGKSEKENRRKMSELNLKDSTIKLFGRTIPLPINQEVSFNAEFDDDAADIEDSTGHNLGSGLASLYEGNLTDSLQWQEGNKKFMQADGASHQITEDLNNPTTCSGNCKNPKTPSVDTESSLPKTSKSGEQSDAITEEKTLQKPDKILPCPRCKSTDTKFCYYNNYNVSQPRHFCKNCQRYWTAGGTMRNVPVGAGRRKNKNSSSASHYRQIMVLEALPTAQSNAVNGVHNPSLANNSTVFTFSSDSHLSEPMASVPKLAEKSQNCVQNGLHEPAPKMIVSHLGGDNGDDGSSRSSITAPNSLEKKSNAGLQEPAIKNHQIFPSQVPYFPGPPWPYPWNPVQWNTTMHPPAFYPSGVPVPFYPPPAYWGCTVPGAWNIPCLTLSAPNSNPNSSLQKHSREGNLLNPVTAERKHAAKENNNTESCIRIPKTLRIDDPTETSMSSIWTTLGIQSEKNTNSANGSGLFKAFQSTREDKTHSVQKSPLLQANPAAVSRSLNFHEST